jgi:hypothetical protein
LRITNIGRNSRRLNRKHRLFGICRCGNGRSCPEIIAQDAFWPAQPQVKMLFLLRFYRQRRGMELAWGERQIS